jgi:hypothetical protein
MCGTNRCAGAPWSGCLLSTIFTPNCYEIDKLGRLFQPRPMATSLNPAFLVNCNYLSKLYEVVIIDQTIVSTKDQVDWLVNCRQQSRVID